MDKEKGYVIVVCDSDGISYVASYVIEHEEDTSEMTKDIKEAAVFSTRIHADTIFNALYYGGVAFGDDGIMYIAMVVELI